MKNHSLPDAFLLIVFLTGISHAACTAALAEDITHKQLPLSTSSKFLSPPPPTDPEERICGSGRHCHTEDFEVLAPIDRPTDFVAIVEILPPPNFRIELNPKGFNYGDVPRLSQLKESETDSLFGNSVSKSKDYRRYKFVSKLQNKYVADLRFSDGFVDAYRVYDGRLEDIEKIPTSVMEKDWRKVVRRGAYAELSKEDLRKFFPQAYEARYGK